VQVLAGVNLPMLVKALNSRRGPLEELVQTLVGSAKAAIIEVEPDAGAGGGDAAG
jgi:mannose/fructose-specific phosphotransferase system component IIA